ncbi:MAG: cobaltochelatase CobT-related protein [Rubrivivax sp.]
MSEVQQLARRQQRVEELCAGAIRALSGEADLHFRGRRLHRAAQRLPLFAPHLHPLIESDDFGSFRGAADGLALRLRFSDATLHAGLCPTAPVARLVFELLEQIRVESLVPAGLDGVARNLRHRFEQWSLSFHRSRLTDSARGILLYTVAQVCRARVTGEPVLEATEDLMEATRAALSPAMGTDLAGLRRQRHDQAAYAVHALAIAALVAEMLRSADDEDSTRADRVDVEDSERAAFSLVMELDARVEEGVAAAVSGHSRAFEAAQGRYCIYTTAYDRELQAAALARADVLREHRAQLDRLVAGSGLNGPRLARELKALLARPANDGWDSAMEEGRIDGRRLAQLIASPTERRLFRREHVSAEADCVLAFLIDCSGSMKQHIEAVATLVDVFARALEHAGVASEVLGFTTGAWNGGRARRDWLKAGQPPQPGRLNEAMHIVFKDADTRWRFARAGIAALLEAELFREGIDGEAVDWAVARLQARPEARKLLVVVSDGCPMDGATNLANDAYYLDNHLKQVLQWHEHAGCVEICALGVGLDLSPFYSRCQALDVGTPPGHAVLRDILQLLARPARR